MPPSKGINWTIISLGLSTGATLVYIGIATGSIKTEMASYKEQVAVQRQKDFAQDMLLFDHADRINTVEVEMKAVKEGRYNNIIQYLPNTPRVDSGAGSRK